MVTIRIQAVTDEANGQVRAELYIGAAQDPIMRSEPAFASEEDLVRQTLEMFRTHFPDHFPFTDDPTIGV